jgi:hypothetical protein
MQWGELSRNKINGQQATPLAHQRRTSTNRHFSDELQIPIASFRLKGKMCQ